MIGVVSKVSGDLGNKLVISQVGQPLLGALIDFFVGLKKHWNYQGRGHDLLKAKCDDANHNLNYAATITYNNTGTRSATDISKCKVL
jgi:hypothetical protein